MRQFFRCRFFGLIALCGLFSSVNCQNIRIISGRVTDAADGTPLAFAHISIKNDVRGTVTNNDGHFKLVAGMSGSDTLLIAYLGYSQAVVRVCNADSGEIRITLSRLPLQLAEVEIRGLTPQEVIRRMVAAIPDNYGDRPLLLTAFVRSRKSVGGRMAEFTEALIRDFKAGYTHYDLKKEKARRERSNVPLLLKGRIISDTTLVNAMGDIGQNAGCLGCNFMHDFVEFYKNTALDEAMFRYYTYSMEELIIPGTGKVYHISFDQGKDVKKRLWRGEFYIHGADFALLQFMQKPSYNAFEVYEKDKFDRYFTIASEPGWIQEMPLLEQTATYGMRSGKYCLSTIRTESWLNFRNLHSGKTVKFGLKNEVVVTEITRDSATIADFKGDKSIGVSQRWDQVIGKGDDGFWTGFDYLPVDQALLEDLKVMGK